MKNLEKLKLITQKINEVPINTAEGKKAKKEDIKYYKENQNRFSEISVDYIQNFDFSSGVLNKAYNLKKLKFFNKHLSKKVLGLNTHKYAPELNTLVFMDGSEIKMWGIFNYSEAIEKLIESSSLEELKKL